MLAAWTVRGSILGANDSDPFAVYGARSADYLLRRVQSLPEADRSRALKIILDGLDPSLWINVSALVTRLLTTGLTPAAALQAALAKALADGMLAAVIAKGRAQTGLGATMAMTPAQTAIMNSRVTVKSGSVDTSKVTATFVASKPIPWAQTNFATDPACALVIDYDGTDLFNSVPPGTALATAKNNALRAGPSAPADMALMADMRDLSQDPNNPRMPLLRRRTEGNRAPCFLQAIAVGPFSFPLIGPAAVISHGQTADKDWKAFIADQLRAIGKLEPVGQSSRVGPVDNFETARWLSIPMWMTGRVCDVGPSSCIGRTNWDYTNGRLPFVKSTHPVHKVPYGLYFSTQHNPANVNDVSALFEWKKIPPPADNREWWQKVGDFLYDLPSDIVHAVVDAAKAVGNAVEDAAKALANAACDLLNNPAASSVAAAAPMAGPYGAAAATGIAIGQQLCAKTPPPPPPPLPPPPPPPPETPKAFYQTTGFRVMLGVAAVGTAAFLLRR